MEKCGRLARVLHVSGRQCIGRLIANQGTVRSVHLRMPFVKRLQIKMTISVATIRFRIYNIVSPSSNICSVTET